MAGPFSITLSRRRYQEILRVLRFDNAQSRRKNRSPDKLQPIREVFETWDSCLRDSYTCGSSMTVDEQLVCFRRRCPFKQYILSKPGKYGIKIWTICNSICSYTWKMQVYTGKDAGSSRETNQGARVVLDLVEDIEKSGRNITCDNFFTNLSLARKLLLKKAHTGRNNEEEQAGAPNGIYSGQRTQCEEHSLWLSTRCNVALYCPKKHRVVNMLSTMHSQPEIDIRFVVPTKCKSALVGTALCITHAV